MYAVPFFILFYLISKKLELTSFEQNDNANRDFGLLIRDLMDQRADEAGVRKASMVHLESNLKRSSIRISIIGFFSDAL